MKPLAFTKLGDGNYEVIIPAITIGTYTAQITASLLNYAINVQQFRFVVTTRTTVINLSTTNVDNAVSVIQNGQITITVSLTDQITGAALNNATISFEVNGEDYVFSPTNTPGEYSITLNTTTLSQLPVLSQYPLLCTVHITNYTQTTFSIYLNIGLPVDPILHIPYLYWLIGVIVIGSFMAIVISFRVYRKATIPIELQNLDMIRNQISKKKAISRRRLGKTKDEEILKQFALDWRVLGLNLGDILGIKQIQEHMAQHDKEVASLDKSDAVVDEKIIELEDKIRGFYFGY